MITVLINKDNIEGFESISVSANVNNISGQFKLAVSGQEFVNLNLAQLALQNTIQIKIGQEIILNGFIENVSSDGTITKHIVTFSGRDKTGDLIDSTFEKSPDFTGKNSFVDIIKTVLSNLNIPGIEVINKVEDIKDFETIEQPSIGQSGFDFIESLARIKQVLLTRDGNGNIVISRGEINETGASLLFRVGEGEENNNVKEYTFRGSTQNLFNRYVVKGQGNPINSLFSGQPVVNSTEITDIDGVSEDKDIRTSRTLTIQAETALDNDVAEARAVWQNNFNKSQAFVHTAIVVGFTRQNGALWKGGDVVNYINDQIAFSAPQVVTGVNFQFSLKNGSTTTLTLLDKDAYTLSVVKPADEIEATQDGASLLASPN